MGPTVQRSADLGLRMSEDKILVEVTDPSSTDFPAVLVSPQWRVVVRLGRRTLELPYYTPDSLDEPTPVEIMRELIQEALRIEDTDSLEEWAGVTPGQQIPIRDEQAYYANRERTGRLRYLLGDKYDDYLRNTDL